MNNLPLPDPTALTSDVTPLLTITDVCNVLRITRWSVYQLINNGRLKTVRIGRRRLVATADLASFIKSLRAEETYDAT